MANRGDMKKISVATVPPIFELVAREDNEEGNVYCQGLTAKLHSRFGSSQSDKQASRVRKESRMPPIPSARSSTSSRKTSSSLGNDGFYPYTPIEKDRDLSKLENDLTIVGETGYLTLNSRKKSAAEKLNDTAIQLYTLEDSKRLPKILKPKKKVGRGSKRKKIKDDQSTLSNESQGELIPNQLSDAKDGSKGNSEDSEEMYKKYGLDLKKEFNMEMTRPFTYSYFPEIYSRNKKVKKKETRNNNNYKMRKISQIETKTPLY